MDVYGKVTCLHGSDRHVLNKYGSEFYEYSPESISAKKPSGTEAGLINMKNTPTALKSKEQLK